MRFALQVGLIALLATAVYYRFARHDAGTYYLLFGAWIVILAFYVFPTARIETDHYSFASSLQVPPPLALATTNTLLLFTDH